MKDLLPWKWGKKRGLAPVDSDKWFENFWDHPLNSLSVFGEKPFSGLPAVDVSEDTKEVTVRAELPGLSEKDIDLTYQGGILSIRGEKKEERESKEKSAYYKEIRQGSFSRDIPLREGLLWHNAKAKYKNGMLTIAIPKKEEKRIEVKVN
jgi:HSP20 family protein